MSWIAFANEMSLGQTLKMVGLILICVGLTLILVALALRKTGGHAPGWQLRCTSCNRTRDAAECGVVRIGAVSAGKRTLGWCSACRRLRAIAIERKPATDAGSTATTSPTTP